MPTNLDFFIDCHHHMFTIADIPIYQTIKQAAHDNITLPKKMLIPLLSFYLPIVNADKKVERLEKFMRFFEHEQDENVKQMVNEILELIDDEGVPLFKFTTEEVLLTPLILDIDLGGGVSKLASQVKRLSDAIKQINPTRVKILPFLGIDPRRNDFSNWLSLITPLSRRGGYSNSENGDFIGVKLYPSLGFNPKDHINFCREISARDLPVTVHCQQGSLKLVDDADDLNNPRNWQIVLKKMENDDKKLIINFAHFGSEDEVAATIEFKERDYIPPPPRWEYDGHSINTDTWTYQIIRMLKKYPKTFSDLSAFDFSNSRATAALHWLIHLDRNGQFGSEGDYLLEDKLLWGTDYPMTLKVGNITYTKLFTEFINAISRNDYNIFPYPPLMTEFDAGALIKKIVNINPKNFLGL